MARKRKHLQFQTTTHFRFLFNKLQFTSASLCSGRCGGEYGERNLSTLLLVLTFDKQKGGNCVEISCDFLSFVLFNIQSILFPSQLQIHRDILVHLSSAQKKYAERFISDMAPEWWIHTSWWWKHIFLVTKKKIIEIECLITIWIFLPCRRGNTQFMS